MLIQLQIEKIIERLQASSKRGTKSDESLLNTFDSSSVESDSESVASSILERTRHHFSTQHKNAIEMLKILSKHDQKAQKVCSETLNSDKVCALVTQIVRMVGSLIKFVRTFNLVQNSERLTHLSLQIVQLRRLLRVNRLASFLKEIGSLISKPNKQWLDLYNIAFKTLQFVLDVNDSIGYLQQLKLISTQQYFLSTSRIKANTSNLYFVECLMWLFLNTYDYLKSYRTRSRKENLKKELSVLKYALDSFTSHNQFAFRLFQCTPETITIVGTISSVAGLYAVWI